MANVLIVAYLLIVLALIAVILLQRSEGGGLGMGGNAGGLMTVRGSANLLTRTTAVLAALFFATAIGLTILSEIDRGADSIVNQAVGTAPDGSAAPTTVLDAFKKLQADGTAPAGNDPGLAVPAPADATPAAGVSAPAPGATNSGATSSGAAPASGAPAAPGN